jgi:hypothetical protein
MSGSVRDLLVELLARLRLACEAMGVDPADVELADLGAIDRERLRTAATFDLAALTTGRQVRAARQAKPLDDRAARRQAAFREMIGRARAKALRDKVREDVLRGAKRERCEQANAREALPCGVVSRHHKVG